MLAVAVCAVAYAAEEKVEEKKEEVAVEAEVKEADPEPKEITDDGSYYPGKYPGTATVIVPSFYHGLVPSVAAVPSVHYVHPAVYPYAYSHLPITKTIVV